MYLEVQLPDDITERFSLKILHLRQRDANGRIPTKGGSTVVVMRQMWTGNFQEGTPVLTGTAYCHINDTYDKKKGVVSAIYKVLKKVYPDLVLSSVHTSAQSLLVNMTNERFWLDARQ